MIQITSSNIDEVFANDPGFLVDVELRIPLRAGVTQFHMMKRELYNDEAYKASTSALEDGFIVIVNESGD